MIMMANKHSDTALLILGIYAVCHLWMHIHHQKHSKELLSKEIITFPNHGHTTQSRHHLYGIM